MKPILTRIATGIAIVFLLASCTTLQRTTDEGGAAYMAGLLNNGRAVKLAKLSSSPFLVDGEIIALPEDTAAFWEGVVKAGIRLDQEPVRSAAVRTETWKEFGSTRDVQLFFDKPGLKGARLFELATLDGRRVLVLYWSSKKSVRLHGFKGPF